jgi:pimeloyl-ACP methyl ester carboxylesterase
MRSRITDRQPSTSAFWRTYLARRADDTFNKHNGLKATVEVSAATPCGFPNIEELPAKRRASNPRTYLLKAAQYAASDWFSRILVCCGSDMRSIQTELLNISFEAGGSPSGYPVVLLHGWPDAVQAWQNVATTLQQSGYRTVAPFLRGSYPTEFLSADTPRFAGAVAMAQDVVDLANLLGIGKFAVVGHDWGARIAYTLAALFPERISSIAALALAYQPRGEFHLGTFAQSRQFWYQFFQCTDAGANAVRRDPIGFARIQWETWSPKGWFKEEDFDAVSSSFNTSDWVEITLNGYRSRYLSSEVVDHRYDHLQERLRKTARIEVPTLMIQGASDTCDLPLASEGQEKHFLNGYSRIVLSGVGHFPHREAPEEVANTVLRLLARP